MQVDNSLAMMISNYSCYQFFPKTTTSSKTSVRQLHKEQCCHETLPHHLDHLSTLQMYSETSFFWYV